MKSQNNKKVIKFTEATKPAYMIETVKGLLEDLENDRVVDFIIISRVKAGKADEHYDGHEIKFNWMARKSTITCLGLLDYMSSKIKDYIWGRE